MCFSADANVCHLDNVKHSVELMNEKTTKLFLQFLKKVLEHFTKLNTEFQSDNVLIHKLHDCLIEFLRLCY